MILFNRQQVTESYLRMMLDARYRLRKNQDGDVIVMLPNPYRGDCGIVTGELAGKLILEYSLDGGLK